MNYEAVDAHFKGTRQGHKQRGREIVKGANFEGARNQVQVQDGGEERDGQRQFRATPRQIFLIIPK